MNKNKFFLPLFLALQIKKSKQHFPQEIHGIWENDQDSSQSPTQVKASGTHLSVILGKNKNHEHSTYIFKGVVQNEKIRRD